MSPVKPDNNILLISLCEMAKDLKERCIVTRNARSPSLCNEYVKMYNDIRKKVLTELEKINIDIPLPTVYPTPYINSQGEAKLSEVATAAGQIVSLINGLKKPLTDELNKLKYENEKLENELKSIKPFIPNEITIKTPMQIQKTINELNESYIRGNNTACAMLLRKLIDNSIDIKSKMKKIENKFKDPNKNEFYDLPKKIDIASNEGILNKNISSQLKRIKLYGDSAAHSYNIEILPQDIEDSKIPTRLAIEEIFSK
jgi:hypothetical protein